MPFKRESFVPVCTSPYFHLPQRRYSAFQFLRNTELCTNFVQTKVGEIQTDTNDSLSNAVGFILISLNMTDLAHFRNFEIAVSSNPLRYK